MKSLNIPELWLKKLFPYTLCVCVCVCARVRASLLSHVQFFVTPWTVAHQAHLYSNNN